MSGPVPIDRAAVAALVIRLAAVGILGMYGGSKGHGFWLYRGATPRADAEIRAGRGFERMCTLFGDAGMECIEHPAVAPPSGNRYFWLFEETAQLVDDLDARLAAIAQQQRAEVAPC